MVSKQPLKANAKIALWAAFAFMIICVSLFARVYAGQPLEGDQPHYIIMANSLIRQGDLNLKDDYERKLYQPVLHIESIDAHINFGLVNPNSDKWYSIHSPGLPIIIAPILALAGLKGVMLLLVLFSTLLCVLTYFWSLRLTKSMKASIVATGSLLFSIMYLNMAGYIFVDIPLACIFLSCLLMLDTTRTKPSRLLYAAVGILTGISLWLHVKTELISGTIILIGVYQIFTARGSRLVKRSFACYLIIPFAVIFLLLCYEVHRWFGVWLPSQIYQGNGQLFQLSLVHSVSAILLDSFKGILTPNPAFLLVFSGLPIWWRVQKRSLLWVFIVILPSFLVQATFNDWAGGWSPAGRYPIEWLPLFIPAIAFSLIHMRGTFNRILQAMLLLTGALLGIAYIYLRVPWVYAGVSSPLFEKLGVVHYVPRFDANANLLSTPWSIVGAIAIILCCFFLGYRASRKLTI